MRKTTLAISLILIAFAFTACKPSGPEAVVEKYYTHFTKGEFDEAKKYVLEEHHSYYDFLKQLSAAAPDSIKAKEVKVTDIKCEITDETAVCTCMVKEGDQDPQEQTLQLKKVNDTWFVNQGKEGGMPTEGDDQSSEEIEEIEEVVNEEVITE